MSNHADTLILSASISGFGYHPGATGQAERLVEVAYYRELVQAAERGLLDFVLLQDVRALPDNAAYGRLDALSVLSRLAPETSSVGLAVSKPTTYSEPFTVSREIATLDFVSGGRAAWNATSSATDDEAQNFGHEQVPDASERQTVTEEFVEVSRKLWDSWEDDAVITDRERGFYLDPTKLHHINHVGSHFKIRGPQITYRPPQGHVVVVQVDDGDAGTSLDVRVADVLVLHHESLEQGQRTYAQIQQEAASAGREIRILQSILPIIGASEEAAQARGAELDAAAKNGIAPHATRIVGTAAQVADQLEQWFRTGATDGFHFLPAVLPDGLNEIVDQLVPELQRRGLFHTSYNGRTLREHLGLSRPISQYAAVASR